MRLDSARRTHRWSAANPQDAMAVHSAPPPDGALRIALPHRWVPDTASEASTSSASAATAAARLEIPVRLLAEPVRERVAGRGVIGTRLEAPDWVESHRPIALAPVGGKTLAVDCRNAVPTCLARRDDFRALIDRLVDAPRRMALDLPALLPVARAAG